VIEVAIIVAAGMAASGACGAAAARQARRVDVDTADAIVTRAVGPAGYPRARIVAGEVVSSVARPTRPGPDTCPRCGQRPVVAGARAQGPDGRVVAVCGGCMHPTMSTDAAIRGAMRVDGPSSGTCEGRLTLHEDGSATCHGGRDDCLGDTPGYTHEAPVACRSLSHGCGSCQSAGWAS
jgi:hypothetical protein